MLADETVVDNTEVTETLPPPTVEKTEQPPTEAVETVVKETPPEDADRFDKHPRFQELNQRAKDAESQLVRYREAERQAKLADLNKPVTDTPKPDDPYAGMTPEEQQQTRQFIDKFVMPEVERRTQPFIREVQTNKLTKQVNDAKTFASSFGINFDEKLPEIVDYLSRPENKGRLSATEAVRNLYFDDMVTYTKSQSTGELQKQKEELMEKKKAANMQSSTVAQGSVVQSDEMARRQMTPQERLSADVRYAMDKAKAGERHPKVKVD